MIDRKGLLLLAGLLCGPFISVGATVFYRRALQWWYEHEIDMSPDDAMIASWAVLSLICIVIFWAVTHRAVFERWPWVPE